ncbi:MAG TPA: hypothetical protein VJH89_00040 [Patescibacteria group bacterium]|nr:hypothetical protein [Patescibacteria group bacterium]
MDRILERNGSDIIAMTMMLYSLPRREASTESLLVFPGLGETWRLTQAIQCWDTVATAKYLLIAGHNQREKMWASLTLDTLTEPPFNLKRHKGVYVVSHAEHTKEQAQWVVEKIQELNISSLALFVSPYHLLRAYCTVLRMLIKHGIQIPMIPVPISIAPDTKIPEINASAWDMVQGEVERFSLYQEKDDVATYDEFKKYITWLWTQKLLQ